MHIISHQSSPMTHTLLIQHYCIKLFFTLELVGILAPIYSLMVNQDESLGNSTALQQQFRTII
jgi:hypothetical protein